MKPVRTLPVLLALAAASLVARAEEDYTRLNPAFSPKENRRDLPPAWPAAERSAPQDRRLDYPAVEKGIAAVADRRAPIAVAETTRKKVLPPSADKRTESVRLPELSALSQQAARISTAEAKKPELVSKYQRQLESAQTVQIGRTPSTDRGGEARLNRFVFRHNEPNKLTQPAQAMRAGRAAANPE